MFGGFERNNLRDIYRKVVEGAEFTFWLTSLLNGYEGQSVYDIGIEIAQKMKQIWGDEAVDDTFHRYMVNNFPQYAVYYLITTVLETAIYDFHEEGHDEDAPVLSAESYGITLAEGFWPHLQDGFAEVERWLADPDVPASDKHKNLVRIKLGKTKSLFEKVFKRES